MAALGLFKELVVDDVVGTDDRTDDLLADAAGLLAKVLMQLLVDF